MTPAIDPRFFAKYDVPVPRYTSYPPVPAWSTAPSVETWIDSLARALSPDDSTLALYVHIPYCESLCTFCGCNTVITRDHGKENTYVAMVLRELDLYLQKVPLLASRPLRQLHLGGGTPTFLSSASLRTLIEGVAARLSSRTDDFEGAIEVDPRVTTAEQLETLRSCGMNRVSFGVQDIDPHVQRLVNRIQPPELTAALVAAARASEFGSISLDLIYGLPGQTEASMKRLTDEVLRLAPDRLAVYSFARVPWIKPAQRRFKDEDVPVGAAKRALYDVVREAVVDAGYLEIGMDHFARPHDALAKAALEGRLHRNFMGYTDTHTRALLALGVSGISETPDCYHQNEKVATVYERRVNAGEIPMLRGHLLSREDQRRAGQITALMTRYRVELDAGDLDAARPALAPLIDDGLVRVEGTTLLVPPAGRPFLRHAASAFDAYFTTDPGTPRYSNAV